jgi:hypothetical protein
VNRSLVGKKSITETALIVILSILLLPGCAGLRSDDSVQPTVDSAPDTTASPTVESMAVSTASPMVETVRGDVPRTVSGWWDDDFFCRRRLTIVPAAPVDDVSDAAAQIPLRLTVDTEGWVQSGSLRRDGGDLRVVYWDGAQWRELPREVRQPGATNTVVWFPLQGPLSEANYDYYLYYCYAIGSEPPRNIYDVFGGAQTLVAHLDGQLEGSRWEQTEVGGDGFAWVEGRHSGQVAALLTNTATLSYESTTVPTQSGTITFSFQPQWPADDGREHYLFQSGSGDYGVALVKGADGALHFRVGGAPPVATASATPSWTAGEWLDLVAVWDALDAVWYLNGQPMAQAGIAPIPSAEAQPMWVGSEAGGSAETSAQAAFSDLVVYNQPLTPEQVLSRYRASQVTIEIGEEENSAATVTIQSGEGATLVSLDGTVTIKVAAGTFAETVDFTHMPYQATVPQGGGSLTRFVLSATTESGAPVTEVALPIEITLDYSQMGVDPSLEETIAAFIWDDAAQEWQHIVTYVDVSSHQATVSLDRLGDLGYSVTGFIGSPR